MILLTRGPAFAERMSVGLSILQCQCYSVCVLNGKTKFWLNVDTVLINHLRVYDSTYQRSSFRGPNVSWTANITVSMSQCQCQCRLYFLFPITEGYLCTEMPSQGAWYKFNSKIKINTHYVRALIRNYRLRASWYCTSTIFSKNEFQY